MKLIDENINFYIENNKYSSTGTLNAEFNLLVDKEIPLIDFNNEKKMLEHDNELKKDIHNQIYSDFLLQDLTEAEIILGQLYQLMPIRKETKEQESALVVQKREMLKDVYQKLADKIQTMYIKVKGRY